MLLTEKEAKAICNKLLSYVKADDAEVNLRSQDYSHLRFAANGFTSSGGLMDTQASVTVWINQRKGSATTNEVDDTSLRSVVQLAEELARISPVDIEYLPTLSPQQYKSVHGYVEATPNISPPTRAKLINEVIEGCENNKVVGAGFHQARGSASAAATKHGNFYYHRSSLASFSLTARTPKGDGSGYFSRNHFDVVKLDTARIAHEAIQKAITSREPQTLEPGVYAVVLEPQAVADLLSLPFDARSTDEGRSCFSAPGGKTRLGEKVFDERLNFFSDPWHPELPGSPAAQDGIPAQKFHLVRNGILENLVYSRFWAKEKHRDPTPGPVNEIMESSTPPVSLEDMILDTKTGLLVSRFWYIRSVDPRTALLTGLTRDGLWYIENGKRLHPVRNFRFNQSILQMLAPGNVDLIGSPERVGSSEGGNPVLFPPLKIKEFHFTSQSEAV